MKNVSRAEHQDERTRFVYTRSWQTTNIFAQESNAEERDQSQSNYALIVMFDY